MTTILDPKIENSWKEILKDEFAKDYFASLKEFLVDERQKYRIYPKGSHIFSAFDFAPFQDVKVVILGQDPYHGPGQAHGLSFSVPAGIRKPPSLINILKEVEADLGFPAPESGNLEKWAKQGVLLLNATLTVREAQAGSHQNHGWETFTDEVIKLLSEKRENIVFLLWGSYAISKEKFIDTQKHCVLKTVHPSPLSAHRGFLGCKHFSLANQYLAEKGLQPIDWNLNE